MIIKDNSNSASGKLYLTKTNKFSFAIAGFGQNMIIGLVNSYLLFFYTDVFLLGAGATTALMIIARIWDALNDPIMGTFVDKTRTKFGKMRPYIIWISLPLALSTALLFIVPTGFSEIGKTIYAYVTYILWGMIYTVCDVPFWGLPSAMTPNQKERISFITGSRLVHAIGAALPMMIVPIVTGIIGNALGYTVMGIGIGIIGGAMFSLAFFGTKERVIPSEKSPTLKECFKYLKINKPLRTVVIANVLGFTRRLPMIAGMYVATYILQNYSLNLFGWNLELSGSMLNTIMIAGWATAGFIGMIFTPALCKKFDYRKIFAICSIIGAIASVTLYFVGASFIAIFCFQLVIGFPYGIIDNINYTMISESIEYVEWKTGKRTEGVTVSFQTLMNKLMTALQTATVSLSLIILNFVQPIAVNGENITQPQSDFTLNGFFFLITILPAIGWILSIIPMIFYKFIGKEREQAQTELLARRASANK